MIHLPERKTLRAYRDAIVLQWALIAREAERRGVKPGAVCPDTPRLLGTSTKTVKGNAQGILTAILYLPPASQGYVEESRKTLCPWSTAECRAACLVDSGMLSMTDRARHWKLALLTGAHELFAGLLDLEIAALERKAKRGGMIPAVRLDGTSDIGLARQHAPRHPGVTFYDYTKSLTRAAGHRPENWYVTFSYSGHNLEASRAVLASGGNVATVFAVQPGIKGRREPEPKPETWEGYPVLDGDDSDARFADPPGHVVGLSLKGSLPWEARVARAGAFCVRPRRPLPMAQIEGA